MFGKIRLLLLLLAIIPGALLAQTTRISPELQMRLTENAEQPIEVYLLLNDRVDAAAIEAYFERENVPINERVPILIDTLKRTAKRTQADVLESLKETEGVNFSSLRTYWVANVIFVKATPDAIASLSRNPDIALIDENYQLRPIGLAMVESPVMPASPGGRESGISAINAPALWKLGYTGYGRRAMIIDTGEDTDHPAIRNQFLGQTAPVEHAWSSNSLPGPCLSNDFGVASHGTHVTGTIVGLDRSNRDTIGVAFNGQWMAGGVILSGCDGYEGGSAESIVSNFEWALDPDGNPNTIEDMPDVINNSWGRNNPPQSHCDGNFSLSLDLADALYAAGTALVFSAGNEGPGEATHVSPAFISADTVKVFSIGAVNANSGNLPIAGFSSRGPTTCELPDGSLKIKPEVVAPGVNVRSAVIGGGYQQFSGTSMAAPHVAGAILLLKEAFPDLTGEELMKALYFTAEDLGEEGEDNTYGRGMINVESAFYYLLEKGYSPAPPASSARDLVLIDVQTNGVHCDSRFQPAFVVENNGTDTIFTFDVLIETTTGPPASFLVPVYETLEPGTRRNILLPLPVELDEGAYTLRFELVNPDSSSDDRPLNNTLLLEVMITSTPSYAVESPQMAPLCNGGSVLALYEPNGDNELMYWYNDISDGDLLGIGNRFLSPPLNGSENQLTLWAELRHTRSAGLPEIPEDSPFEDSYFSSSGGLVFNAYRPFVLKSASVYAKEKTGAVIVLKDQYGSTLETVPKGLNAGWNRVTLNLNVPQGEGLVLTVSKGNQQLLQETGAIGYPLLTEDILLITGSADTITPLGLYQFFFDWEIDYADACSRVPLTLDLSETAAPEASFLINSITTVSDGSFKLTLQGIGQNIEEWEWQTHPLGLTATGQTPVITFPESGIYSIDLLVTTEAGCTHAITRTIELGQATSSESVVKEPAAITLYPNPTKGSFSILLTEETANTGNLPMTVTITDQLGRLVYGPVELDRTISTEVTPPKLPIGLYFVRISREGQHMVHKLVIR